MVDFDMASEMSLSSLISRLLMACLSDTRIFGECGRCKPEIDLVRLWSRSVVGVVKSLTYVDQDCVPSWLCLELVIKTCMKLTNAECTVETPDDGQRSCPKHVEFYDRVNLDN
jgi:hypothetical protein